VREGCANCLGVKRNKEIPRGEDIFCSLRVPSYSVAQMGYNSGMATNAVVRSRISAEVKEKAAAVLEEMGLTVSDVMRIVLTRVARENALPFDLKPNKLTRETLRKTAQGKEIHHAKDAADLFKQLGI
jgi:DNA-damage-inducible protein J